VDITVRTSSGYHGDTSKLFVIGKSPIEEENPAEQADPSVKLATITRECLFLGIREIKPGVTTLGDIGAVIQNHAESHGYSVVTEYVGHGVGRAFHEGPRVEHVGTKGSGSILHSGQVITIEPMINAGAKNVIMSSDQWEVSH